MRKCHGRKNQNINFNPTKRTKYIEWDKKRSFLSAADPPLKVIPNDPEAHKLFPNFHTTFTSRAFY